MTVLVVPEHKPANSSQYKNENKDGEEGSTGVSLSSND